MGGGVRGIVLENVQRKRLIIAGHDGTLSVSQMQIGAGLTGKSSMHSLRHSPTELYLNELRPTLCFGHICGQFLCL